MSKILGIDLGTTNSVAAFWDGGKPRLIRAKGGAKFLGGEGCTYRDGSIVFGSSEGGDAGLGQVWSYTPTDNAGALNEKGELELLFESTARSELDGPDNMTTSPGGAIVIAEDGNLKSNFLKALLPDGSMIEVAENLVAVQQHYLEASGKLYDPTVPDDGRSAGDGVGFSPTCCGKNHWPTWRWNRPWRAMAGRTPSGTVPRSSPATAQHARLDSSVMIASSSSA
jgi:hypothetical protein